MSLVDYSQTADDHQSLLILIRHTGSNLTTQAFNSAWDRIRHVDCIHIQGQKRNIWVRYKRGYPKENNEWGDFQAHRKVLGLISVGKCSSHEEFESLFEAYKSVKDEYSSTIYNSRLIVFGMNKDGSPFTDSELPPEVTVENGQVKDGQHKSSLIEANVKDKRTDRHVRQTDGPLKHSKEETSHLGSHSLMVADSSETVTSEISSQRSHSGSLTKESTGAEVVFYPSLEKSDDLEERLREFITSLFFVLEGKRLDRSFERTERLQLLCAPFEKKDYVGIDPESKSVKKKCMGRLRKHLADLCLQAGMPGEAILHYQTALDVLRAVNDFLWMGGCYEGLSTASVILKYPKTPTLKRNLSLSVTKGTSMDAAARSIPYANGLDMIDRTAAGVLHPDDIIEKYEEAIKHYSKYKSAAMIEMEASFKACRVLVLQKKYLQASDFLQNVVYINLHVADDDRIHRYSTLASLYSEIGFHRKASFFKRIAGMQCVAPGTSAGWHQCYYLLLQALGGYNISLDPKEFVKAHPNGWPVIQHRILHELVYSARRMGNPQLAVRHGSFLLHTMYDHLTDAQRQEALNNLETVTAKCEGVPHPLALDNGVVLPAVALTHLPYVKSFKVLALAPHLQPIKLDCDRNLKHNVFIYTPLTLTESKCLTSPKLDFLWVAGDTCEVHLQVVNPLKRELKIQYIGLLIEGVEMDQFPASPTLPAQSPSVHVKLLAQPKTRGQLKILGYCTHVLGVRSNCKLKDLPQIPQSHLEVEVVPSLPQITMESSLPKSVHFSSMGDCANIVSSASAMLYAGQSLECLITIQNVREINVERLDIVLNSGKSENDYTNKMFTWSKENVTSQLPIEPASQLCFTLAIYGFCDFISPELCSPDVSTPVHSSKSRSESVLDNKVTEALLTVEYSGGNGLKAGYCRQCSLALMVDILPSLYITRWDVLPALSVNHCHLVFDLLNVSSHEIVVEFDKDKEIIIEPQQSRRIPVLIERQEEIPDNKITLDCQSVLSRHLLLEPVSPCSQFLASLVDIRWSIPSTKVTGRVSTEYVVWKKEQLDLIRVSSVRWEVRLNGQLYLPPDIPAFHIGDLVNFDITFKKSPDASNSPASRLSVMITQNAPVTSNSCDISEMSDSVSCLGLLTTYFNKSPQDSYHHSCAFIFHTSGTFVIESELSLFDENELVKTRFRCLPLTEIEIIE